MRDYIYLGLGIKELKDRIREKIPRGYSYGTWYESYHLGITEYLVNIGYIIFSHEKCTYQEYRKCIKNILKDVGVKCTDDGVKEIANFIWFSNFRENNVSATVTLSKLFSKKIRFYERLVINTKFASIFGVIFIILTELSNFAMLGTFDNPRRIYWMFWPSLVLGMFGPAVVITGECNKRCLLVLTLSTIPVFYCYSVVENDPYMTSSYVWMCITVFLFWVAFAFYLLIKWRGKMESGGESILD